MTAEEYISRIPLWTREKNSLADIRRFLDFLGNPDRKIPVIHVAGTNGKGSVCAYLSSALKEAGYRVGTFISPHLSEVRERFLLQGLPADKPLFEEVFFQVKEAAEHLTREGLCHPTFFEFLFYMAALLFARQNVDFWVMETGLGGRLDTTNVVEHPRICVITSISLEHTRYLGDSLEKIAEEKAGIIKKKVPVVYDGNSVAAARVIQEKAVQMEAPVYGITREDFFICPRTSGKKGLILREKKKQEQKNLKPKEQESGKTELTEPGFGGWELEISSPAPYQADNGALALKALCVLMEQGDIDPRRKKLLCRGMKKMNWPGRMEEIRPGVYLDGAHNPGGIQAFAEAAKAIPAARRLILFGAVSDKAYEEMIACLCRCLKPDLVVTTHLKSSRDVKDEALQECFRAFGCPVKGFWQADKALAYLLSQKKEEDVVFCLGSLYLIGELRDELQKNLRSEG